MKNKYEIRGDITAIKLHSRKFGAMETIISTNKLQRANEYLRTWTPAYHKRSNRFYVQGNITLADGKKTAISLHRWITSAPNKTEVDHKNHDTLNNTDDNLRTLTKEQNGQNRIGPNRDGTSGKLGVHYSKNEKKWVAACQMKYLGSFETFEEAAKVVDSYRAKYLPYSKEAENIEEAIEIVFPKPRRHLEKQCDIKGIYWNTRKKKWTASLRLDGKRKHLGYFKELKDAIDRQEEARREHKAS